VLLAPGALALINPETLHSCNTVGSAERSFFMLYLDIQWCLQIQKSIRNTETFIPAAAVRLDDKILYMQYIDVMKKLMDQKVHLLEKEQLLLDLSAGVFKKSGLVQELHCNDDSYAGKVARLKALLSSNLGEELTLDDMARQLAANPYTLLRRFKARTGITPHAFRMNCRIEQARKYLQKGLEIAEVALRCGFFDQSHLHRNFKAMTTLTPKEYQINFIQ
jgi:AraC-like DNA-binding protein